MKQVRLTTDQAVAAAQYGARSGGHFVDVKLSRVLNAAGHFIDCEQCQANHRTMLSFQAPVRIDFFIPQSAATVIAQSEAILRTPKDERDARLTSFRGDCSGPLDTGKEQRTKCDGMVRTVLRWILRRLAADRLPHRSNKGKHQPSRGVTTEKIGETE